MCLYCDDYGLLTGRKWDETAVACLFGGTEGNHVNFSSEAIQVAVKLFHICGSENI
jgi:hypothetical protein